MELLNEVELLESIPYMYVYVRCTSRMDKHEPAILANMNEINILCMPLCKYVQKNYMSYIWCYRHLKKGNIKDCSLFINTNEYVKCNHVGSDLWFGRACVWETEQEFHTILLKQCEHTVDLYCIPSLFPLPSIWFSTSWSQQGNKKI